MKTITKVTFTFLALLLVMVLKKFELSLQYEIERSTNDKIALGRPGTQTNLTIFQNVPIPFHQNKINSLPYQKINRKYTFSCKNMDRIQIIKEEVGGGISKSVSIGVFRGQRVVIKRLSNIKRKVIRTETRQLLFLKDILIRDQLDHPVLIKMLGYCVRSIKYDSYKKAPRNGDISAVYEYGEEFNISTLPLSVKSRLKHTLDLANLLIYLQYSPLGSLMIGDFSDHHFLMVNGSIKLIDFDYVHNIEAPCNPKKRECAFLIKCNCQPSPENRNATYHDSTNNCTIGVCTGYNRKINMRRIYKSFFRHLLVPDSFPFGIRSILTNLLIKMKEHILDAEQLADTIRDIISVNRNTNLLL